MNLRMTKHFQTRTCQRYINDNDIEMALTFGVKRHSKNFLGKKSCLRLIEAIEYLIAELEAAKGADKIDLKKILN